MFDSLYVDNYEREHLSKQVLSFNENNSFFRVKNGIVNKKSLQIAIL